MIRPIGVLIAVLVSLLGYAQSEPEFCNRGFQIAMIYHQCWQAADPDKKPLDIHPEVYTKEMVEAYATHMCSEVKPVALECLRKEVQGCSNAQKLINIADDSGGACKRNRLNPFFKKQIIDHLVPVRGDSLCFNITEKSDECYVAAGKKVEDSGLNTGDIGRFHIVADKLFDLLWGCEIDLFKSYQDVCRHWQIPMLLSLQKTAMPSLFGMSLNNYQVSKLELETNPIVTTPSTPFKCEDKSRFYIMLSVLTGSGKARPDEGNVLLQVDTERGQRPVLSVANGNRRPNKDVSNFVDMMVNTQPKPDLEEVNKYKKKPSKYNKGRKMSGHVYKGKKVYDRSSYLDRMID